MQRHQGFMSCHGGKQIVSLRKLDAQLGGELCDHPWAELGVGVEPGAHSRSADGQTAGGPERVCDAVFAQRQLRGIATKLLA
jgi:hypothetical protein